MNRSKLYIKESMGTHCFEIDDVKEVHLSDIQDEEPNGFHATLTFTEEISSENYEKFNKIIQNSRSKRSIERENKKKRRNRLWRW